MCTRRYTHLSSEVPHLDGFVDAICTNFVLVFVSAAVDGVCLQTSESIGCAEELGLPAVVVLNKIDLLPDEVAAQVSILPLSTQSLGTVRLPNYCPLCVDTNVVVCVCVVRYTA